MAGNLWNIFSLMWIKFHKKGDKKVSFVRTNVDTSNEKGSLIYFIDYEIKPFMLVVNQ